MSELVVRPIEAKRMTLPPAAWGPDVEGRRGERMFSWQVNGRTVSERYRATRYVVLVDETSGRHRATVDGVGALFTKPADRRRGYGAAVMTSSVDYSRQEGYTLGMLFCQPHVMPWYRGLGWWLTRDLAVTYQQSDGMLMSLSTPDLWTGLLALSHGLPMFTTLTGVEIAGPLW